MSSWDGRFVWYELMTSDTSGAERFYRDVVGWTIEDFGHPDMRYLILKADGQGIGGLMEIPSDAAARGAQPGWIGYVATPGVDAAAEKLSTLGGHVHHPPADIPGVGRFAIVADPGGAVFALFRGLDIDREEPSPGLDAPGHIGWHELTAGDLERELGFYAALFGWTRADAHDMGPLGQYQLFAAGAQVCGGMMAKPPFVPAPSWLYYFNVDAIRAAGERIAAAGGRVVSGPMQVPGGSWIVQATDPQGAMFALVAPRE